jgi:hypothetical protein
MRRYDPAVSPKAELWLSLDEYERIDLIRAFHQRSKISVPNLEAHAATHAIVENQLAEALPSAVNALQRLLAGGLDRHDAVHAIGCVLMEHLWNLQNKPVSEGDPNQAYFAALDAFTVDSWRKLASE